MEPVCCPPSAGPHTLTFVPALVRASGARGEQQRWTAHQRRAQAEACPPRSRGPLGAAVKSELFPWPSRLGQL